MRKASKVNRKEVILAAAAKLFKEKGYRGTSLREIAAAVGLSKPALYYFFASKDDMLLEVVRIPTEWAREDIGGIVNSDLSPREKLWRAVMSMATSFDLFPNQSTVILHEHHADFMAPHVREYLISRERDYSRLWEQIIAEGMAQGIFRRDVSCRIATFGALEMVRGMAKWYTQGRGLTAAEIGEVYAKMLLDSLCAQSTDVSLTDRAEAREGGPAALNAG